MPKAKSTFVCQTCGYHSQKWIGKCPDCESWNSLVEEKLSPSNGKNRLSADPLEQFKNLDSSDLIDLSGEVVPLQEVGDEDEERVKTGIGEFDRVLGGGIVAGSLVMVGGDPGIGKSTLMLQVLANTNHASLYVAGEESLRQIKSRAQRIGALSEKASILAETNLNKIVEAIFKSRPKLVIVDSIQTLHRDGVESAPGSVSQVRECAALLMHVAKKYSISIFLVGHVTKDGAIAGPKVLEHIVDTVLQFEGDTHHQYRVIRALKNRFGATNELGIFEMCENGLVEVQNPSQLFLRERNLNQAGSAVTSVIEGSRVILVEIQGLAAQSNYGVPQRTASGFDLRRLQLLLAVIERKLNLKLGALDIFLNVVGGLSLSEPAADLAVATAIISSLKDKALEQNTCLIGEIGLGGEIRSVSFIMRRVQEAMKLGFKTIYVPKSNMKEVAGVSSKADLFGVQSMKEIVSLLF